jgi:hypothetical protein
VFPVSNTSHSSQLLLKINLFTVPEFIVDAPVQMPSAGGSMNPPRVDGKYYVVSVGKEVGVFTDWYVLYL